MARPVALLPRLEVDDDAHVGGDGALLGGEDRIQVELVDLGEIADELRDAHDQVGQRIAGNRLAAAHALQHLRRLDAVEHRQRVVLGRRGKPERHVLQHLDQHAAEPEGDQLAEARIGHGADDHLLPAGEHLLHLHAVDLGVGLVPLGVGQDGVIALRHLFGALQSDQHAARLRLVEDIGGDDLQDDRKAHAARELRRGIGRVRHAFARHRDAVGVADELPFRRRKRFAPLGLDLVENLADRALFSLLALPRLRRLLGAASLTAWSSCNSI